MNILATKLRENVLLRRLLGWVWQLVGIFLCWWLAFQVRFDFSTDDIYYHTITPSIWIAVIVFVACIGAFRLYQGLWRFFTFRDCLLTGFAFFVGTVIIGLVIFFSGNLSFSGFPRSVLVINYLLILAWEIGGRGIVRLFRDWRIKRLTGQSPTNQKRIVLVGEPEACDSLIRSLSRQSSQLGEIAAIVTDAARHDGGKLHGIRIFSDLQMVGQVVRKHEAGVVIILAPFTAPNQVRQIIDSVSAEQLNCEYRVVPSIDDIAAGRLDVSQIRKVEIEDLLNRDPYQIDFERLTEFITGKHIMVTGAGGSIGSEICRQVLKLKPKALTLFEISEFLLFEIERELAPSAGGTVIRGITGDVKNQSAVRGAIEDSGHIDIIFHAAAYKHVDLMERNPIACIENNVVGTSVVADIAEEMGVSQFVLISTDKAVRPTSLMGASKRLAESRVIERGGGNTTFKAVRFGNVLGSSGSVVPIFKRQIAKGGPVTVTSKDVTRFFMTIPEAVELVLAASAVSDQQSIMVLEMGDSVKIDTLARRMIELSGYVPDVDIKVEYVGLKSGEKEYEELLTDDENVARTDYDRIWVVKKNADQKPIRFKMAELMELIQSKDEKAIRLFAHQLIPGSKLFDRP